MKKVGLIILCISLWVNAFCMKKDTTPFFGKFQLRQSFQTSDLQQSPAMLQLTIPGTGKSNWLVDAGASVTLSRLSSGPFTSKLVAEFHRNTLVDSQQYNYQAGYNFSWFKRNGNHVTPVWTGNLKYIRDRVDSSNSLAATLNFSLYRSKNKGFDLGRPGYLSNEKYTYQLTPSVEAQYQQLMTSDKQATGSILRPLVDLSASFAWNKKKKDDSVTICKEVDGVLKKVKIKKLEAPQKLLEFAFDYINRYAAVNNTGNGERYTKLLKTGISYYLLSTSTSSVSLGASYNLGSDPLNGLKDQRFWQFSLQLQL
ncbi:MAG: hypothetical protein JWP37_2993 [Mucilaginibacter sp.]|nr:hypothetical protein [Mucilaginibacter sp.]